VALADPATWPTPEHSSSTETTRYGTAQASAWHRCHPRLEHRGPWREHPGLLPIIEGTLIRLQVEHLPGERTPKPLWLWTSDPTVTGSDLDRAWHAFLRRFDLEHTFRFFKQTLGWTTPKLRDPAAADRWTWLVLTVHTQLRLACELTTDLRRPWERPCPAGRLTPARVRRGFRRIHAMITRPAGAPKPSRPGPGRPPGIPNRHRAGRGIGAGLCHGGEREHLAGAVHVHGGDPEPVGGSDDVVDRDAGRHDPPQGSGRG
jgi:hypothetical protein